MSISLGTIIVHYIITSLFIFTLYRSFILRLKAQIPEIQTTLDAIDFLKSKDVSKEFFANK